MTTAEAEDIVSDYGAVLEKASSLGPAAPISMLPYPKEIVKLAIRNCMTNLVRTRIYREELSEPLKSGYTLLATFIPDTDAEIALHATRLPLSVPTLPQDVESLKKLPPEKLREYTPLLEQMLGDNFEKYLTLQKQITEEMGQMLEEIENFEHEQLLKLAAGANLVNEKRDSR